MTCAPGNAKHPAVSAPEINARAAAIKPSATLAISAKASALKADGKDVLSFSAGEPDFKPPAHVVETVRAKLAENAVGYAPVPGMPALRDAVAAELSAYHGHEFTRNNILVSDGAKHSLANFFLVTLNPGEEVVFPAPYWVSYPEMIVERRQGFPTVAIESTFSSPLAYGDVAIVSMHVLKVGTSSVQSRYEIRKKRDGKLSFTADVTTVFMDLDAKKAIPLPDDFRVIFERLLA